MIGGLFIYSFKPHPAARKKVVLGFVAAPVILLSGLLIFDQVNSRSPWNPGQSTSIDLASVELFDARLGFGGLSAATLSGRLRNKGQRPVYGVLVRVLIYEGDKQVDGADISLYLSVPPGEARSFQKLVFGMKPPEKWTWTYRLISAW